MYLVIDGFPLETRLSTSQLGVEKFHLLDCQQLAQVINIVWKTQARN